MIIQKLNNLNITIRSFDMKKYIAIIMLISLVILQACSNGNSKPAESSEETFTFSLGHVANSDHPWNLGAMEFAEMVNEKSDGRITVEIHDGGTLGGELEMIEQLQLGDLDMAIIAGGSHSKIVPEMTVEELPFIFRDNEEAYEKMDGELGQTLLALLEEQGIVGLSYWEDGFFQVTNNDKPIESPDDMTGLKIRVPENEIRLDIFKALNANPIPMSFTELFTALQQGVVDGQTNPLSVIEASKFDEVQDYVSIINVNWGSGLLEISSEAWNKLPEDLQEIMQESADEIKDIQRGYSRERAADNLAILEE